MGLRREFIQRCVAGGTALFSSLYFLTGCGQSGGESDDTETKAVTSCDDLSGVTESDLATREKLGYVQSTPIPDNTCSNCNLYLPPKEESKCGGCMLFKGPVFAEAYCTYWAPKI